ncbi:hypothetical protein M430DRAFT_190065 [Amorphotheca resinae ATCC 22711]|jgi:hypothetical protein|uniref:Uncharacterized protein n=1 Tax=Amorphotheca resinae ATCC 22711 TaxID=857342 RepID=A0A2T3APG8_AMORE|nr:hypothetical protein M430DRAFT_190065 [Amorphotheca resinae ATCC 22711]PSS06899.1 hypothetical protein M430DRAFT_190065 [Amorphotheca resinae ATCC 22711]
MASQTAPRDFQHQPLIETLTNFYNLLAETCYIQTSDILLPPHGANFNPSLGATDGFSPSALTLLSQLPYLSEQCQTISLDGGSTNPLSYLTDPFPDEDGNLSRGSWPDARDPTCLGDEEMKLPEHMVAITLGNLYGTWLIYDLESRASPSILSQTF